MKKSRYSDSQIMDALKRVDAGFAVPDICRELGISSATFYKWRAKYGGMDVSMMSRLKELEEENRRLKKMYLEEKLKAEIVAEALEKKWQGHLTDARWPSKRFKKKGSPSGLLAWHFGSASLAFGMNADWTLRKKRLPTGCCD